MKQKILPLLMAAVITGTAVFGGSIPVLAGDTGTGTSSETGTGTGNGTSSETGTGTGNGTSGETGTGTGNGTSGETGGTTQDQETCKHNWDEGIISREGTCQEEQQILYTCTICGAHMTLDGNLGSHSWGEWTITTPVTCTADGEQSRTCSICGEKTTQRIQTQGHKLVLTEAKAATVAAEGNREYYTCSVCGKLFSDMLAKNEITKASVVIPKLPAPARQTEAPKNDTSPDTGTGTDTVAAAEAEIAAIKNDGDLKDSSFVSLRLKSPKQKKNSLEISWNKVPGAYGYIIYGNACGKNNKLKKIAETGGCKLKCTGLQKGTYYKFNAIAYKLVNGQKKVICKSKTIHVATTKGKYTNFKSVKVNKKKVKLKVKGKFKIKATPVPADKKLKVHVHRGIQYESSNPKVVKVDKKGNLKGLKKGKATIYVYSQSGTYAKVKVTVG